MSKCYGDVTKINFGNSDSQSEYAAHGGNSHGHVYGEVSLDGMRSILHEALKISLANDNNVFQHTGDFKFYDLGSGFGKFPMFASLMGFNQSTGIELDSHRAKFAEERLGVMKKELPTCADKLHYFEGSFLTNTEWAKGKEKRVIFMDSVCWSSFWGDLTAKMESAEWDKDTVVVSLGQSSMGKFQRKSTITVRTSWAGASYVYFFTK